MGPVPETLGLNIVMKMIFVEPQNTDDWVNGTCPCDPVTHDP